MDDGTRVSRRRQHEGEMMVMIDNPPSSFPLHALVDGSATRAAQGRAVGDAPVGERDRKDDGTRISRRRQHEGEIIAMILHGVGDGDAMRAAHASVGVCRTGVM